MSLILVVEPDGHHAEPVGQALAADGFNVKSVASRDEALRAAAYEAPSLVMVSGALPEAVEMMDAFAGKRGGPGVIGLLQSADQISAFEPHADSLLVEPLTDDDYRGAVKRGMAEARTGPAPAPAPPVESQKLSSADIFGDVLAEVEGDSAPEPRKTTSAEIFGDMLAEMEGDDRATSPVEPALAAPPMTDAPVAEAPMAEAPAPSAAPTPPAPPPPRPAPPKPVPIETPGLAEMIRAAAEAPSRGARPASSGRDEIDLRLEKTLSGVLDLGKHKPRTVKPSPSSDSEVDALLSRTLSSLDLGPKGGKAPAAARPRQIPGEASKAAASTSVDETPTTLGSGAAKAAAAQGTDEHLPTFRPVSAGQEFGQYTLLEKIAVGGMAEVWKARMKGVEGFQKTVAIKKILNHLTDNDSFVTMFIDEAKLAAQLSHPNITHIYDLGKLGDDYYIAMEFIEGRNLRSILDAARNNDARVPTGLALLIAARLASALDYAHRKRGFDDHELGLVHRDVSPQNVLLSYEGDIKLCDFGIVKAVSRAQHTQMGALKGKLQYMSPEQAWGRKVDPRSDLFSLGSLLFEMLAGRRLFPGDNEFSVLEAVRECEVPAPREIDPSIPAPVDELVRKALEKDPEARFQSAGEMQQRIESILYGLDPTPSQADLAAFMHEVLSRGADVPSKPKAQTAPPLREHAAPEVAAPAPAALPVAPVEAPVEAILSAPATAARDAKTPGEEPQPYLIPAEELAAEMRQTQTADELPMASNTGEKEEAGKKREVEGEPEVGRVVEVVQPTDAVDPELIKGSKSGRWWILLVLLALAIAAAVAWAMTRPRGEVAPEPTTLAQPAIDAPTTDPDALETTPDAPQGDATEGDESDAEGGAPVSAATDSPSDRASRIESLDMEKMVDEELERRRAALRSELEARERRIEEQLAALRQAQQEEADQSKQEAADATDPPAQRPVAALPGWLVRRLEGSYSAPVPTEPSPSRRASETFTSLSSFELNSLTGLQRALYC